MFVYIPVSPHSLQGIYLEEHLTKQRGGMTIKDCQRWKFIISYLCGFQSLVRLSKEHPPITCREHGVQGNHVVFLSVDMANSLQLVSPMKVLKFPCSLSFLQNLGLFSLFVHYSYLYITHNSQESICAIMTNIVSVLILVITFLT